MSAPTLPLAAGTETAAPRSSRRWLALSVLALAQFLVVLDASRRNPYERRFRAFSHGLAPITVPDNALILTSASPGAVADDSTGANSVLVTELLNHINTKADQTRAAEAIFNQTRVAISRATGGAQVPSVSSSLMEDVSFNAGADGKSGG